MTGPRRGVPAVAAGLALVALLLAGCLGSPGPDADPQPSYVARQPGVDPSRLDACVVHVVTPDGRPVEDAAVALFTRGDVPGWTGWEIEPDDLPDGPWWPGEVDGFPLLAQARTADNGTVVGYVNATRRAGPDALGAPVHVAVAGVPGYTSEIRLETYMSGSEPGVRTSPVDRLSCLAEPVTIVVYPTSRTLSFDGSMATTAWPAPGDVGPVEGPWDPHPIRFHEDRRRALGFAVRLGSLSVELSWTNDAIAWGDLHLAAGEEADRPSRRSDDPFQGPGAGPVAETLHVQDPFLELFAGPSTDSAVQGPVDYTLDVDATFDGAPLAP